MSSSAPFGIRAERWVGYLMVLGAGSGLIPGVGLGWRMNHGAFVRSTMAAGCPLESPGGGCPDLSFRCQSMLLAWSHFWEARDFQLELAWDWWVGSRWVRESHSFPGITMA